MKNFETCFVLFLCVMFTNSETDCIKKRKLEKLLKKAKLELAEKERSLNEKPPTNK